MKIQLTQQIVVSNKSNKFAQLDELCFLSKNLYNVALYHIRQYYKMEDFKKDEKQLKGYTFKYTKGLAGLSNEESKEMYHEPIFHYFKLDDMSESMFRKWFNKEDSDTRKQMLND